MVQEMTMKNGHTLNDGVGKVQDDIDGATVGNVHGVQPRGVRERDAIFCISQEVDLVYVERMQFGGQVDNTPMLISTYTGGCHRTCIHSELAPIDVEAVLVLRKGDNEVRCSLRQRLNINRLEPRRPVIASVHLLSRWM